MLRIVKRMDTAPNKAAQKRLLSVLIAIVAACAIIGLLGYNPITVVIEMVKGSLFTSYRLKETVAKAVPLLAIGLGVTICFQMKFTNIGAEGQFYVGAIVATGVALRFSDAPRALLLPLMMLSSIAGGGLWCAIAAVLKQRFQVNESLVTLMLNYVGIKLTSYLQYGPWRDPAAYGFPKIKSYPEAATLPSVFGVHIGWIIALALALLIFIMLKKTKFGYELSIMGDNATTARYAGLNTNRILYLAVIIGGGLCGLAGMMQASGVEGTLNDQMSIGLGYTGIVVAFMANLHPLALIFVSFFFAVLLQGGSYIQSALQIPSATAEIIQGAILLFVLASDFFSRYKIIRVKKEAANE